MNPVLLAALYLCMALSPVVLAWASGSPPRPLLDELAAAAGILAYSIMLAEFLLSGRFPVISRRIGPDVTMRFHQLFARTALALALVHPFLYQSPVAPERPWDVTRQLTLTSDALSIASGIAAWVLLIVLFVMAMGRDQIGMRYESWRLLHGLGAALIAALLLHHVLEAGRHAADPAMAGLWVALFAIAVTSLAYVYLIKPILQRARPWRLAVARPVAERTWEVTLSPDGHDGLRYEAGQFAWINVGRSSFSVNENPFSISSAPSSGGDLSFVIKELGDFTRSLGELTIGTRVYVDGAHGDLCIAGRSEPGVALIAGGVGLAPMLGILREMRLTGDTRDAVLVYGNRVESQIAYREELDEFATSGVEVTLILSEPSPDWQGRTGMITPDLIRDLFDTPDRRKWLYVLCGPGVMMEGAEEALIAMGVPANHILAEGFIYD